MKLDIEFHYSITFVPYRHRNKQSATAVARTSVEVREIPAAHAPVVMKVGNAGDETDQHARRYALKADGTMREVRFFEGRHFVEAGPVQALAVERPEEIAKTFFGRGNPRNGAVDDPTNPARPVTANEVIGKYSSASRPFVSFSDDKGASKAAELRKLAEMAIIVDGTVFEYTPEPIMKIEGYGERKAQIMPRPSAGHGHFDFDRHRFHDFEYSTNARAALKHAHSIAAYADNMPLYEVLDPSKSRFDGASFDVIKACESLMQTFKSNLKGLPWDGLEAFYAFRDAFADAGDRVTPRLVAAIERVAGLPDPEDVDTVMAVAARIERGKTDDYSFRHREIYRDKARFLAENRLDRIREDAASIVERWQCRPAEAYWENGVGRISSARLNGRRAAELLSEGMVADAAAAAGLDAEPLLQASARGCRILVSEAVGLRPAIAVLETDGRLGVIAAPDGDEAPERLFDGFLAATEQAEDTEADMFLPMGGDFKP